MFAFAELALPYFKGRPRYPLLALCHFSSNGKLRGRDPNGLAPEGAQWLRARKIFVAALEFAAAFSVKS